MTKGGGIVGAALVSGVVLLFCGCNDGDPAAHGAAGTNGSQGGAAGHEPGVGGSKGGGVAGSPGVGAAGGGAAGTGGMAGLGGGGAGADGVGGRGGAGSLGGKAGQAPVNGAGGLGGAPIRVIDPAVSGVAGMAGTRGAGGAGGAAGAPAPIAGTLELVAGQLGGPGTLDSVGVGARFSYIFDLAFDPDDDRAFVLDAETLRAIDGETARVTTLGAFGSLSLLYQRGSLYLYDVPYEDSGAEATLTLHQASPADGHLEATTVVNMSPPVTTYSPLLAWPTGDALFHVSDEGQLSRIDPATGTVTAVPLTGFPSSVSVSTAVMIGQGTILVGVSSALGQPVSISEILSIDIASATATVAATVPSDEYILGLDPGGQFVVLSDGTGNILPPVPLGSGAAPPFVIWPPLVAGPHGDLLFAGASGIQRWDRAASAPTKWAGLERPVGPENLGPGSGVIFPSAPLAITAAGDKAYVTWALTDGLAVVDLTTNAVSALTQPDAVNAAAVLPAPDGTLYVGERADCSVWQLAADPSAPPSALFPAMGFCMSNGGNPLNPANHNFVKSALTFFDGSLLFMSDGINGLFQIDPVAGTWTSHLFYDRYGTRELDRLGLTGAAIGSDGLLYVVGGGSLYRIDHGLGTATVVGPGGTSVAADKQGHVYTTDADSVWRLDLATGRMQRVIGASGSVGVTLGSLPGSLNHPQGLAVTDDGDLLIGNSGEYVVLRAHFQ